MRSWRIFLGICAVLSLQLFRGLDLGWAEQNCLVVKTLGPDEKLGWRRKVFRFEAVGPTAAVALDVDGDGVQEMVVRDEKANYFLLEFLKGEELRTNKLELGDYKPLSDKLQRIGERGDKKDRLFWHHGILMQALEVDKESRSLRNLSQWKPEGKATYRPASTPSGWRCSERPGPTTRIIYSEEEVTCQNCKCSACLNLLSPFSSAPDPTFRCTDANSLTGALPLDIDGDGVDEVIYSSKDLSIWYFPRFGDVPSVWAEFSNRIPWKHFFLGDFNGDGLGDILLLSELFRSAWIANSQGSFAIESAIQAPFPSSYKLKITAVGDFDGNGTSDIADVRERDGITEVEIAFRDKPAVIEKEITLLDVEIHPLAFLFSFPGPVTSFVQHSEQGSARFCSLRDDVEHLLVVGTPGETLREMKRTILMPWPIEMGLMYRNPSSPKIVGDFRDYSIFPNYPKVCLGYHLFDDRQTSTKWGGNFRLCAARFGIFGSSEGFKEQRLGSGVVANCCPLPFADILQAREEKAVRVCPENMIITGTYLNDETCKDCPLKIRCTQINTDRYRLGPPHPGRYWGSGFSGRMQDTRYQLSDIPLGIRLGVARDRYGGVSVDGCIGVPPGALLTARNGKSCSDTEYRELLYRGLPGDPADGTPVKMFPDCRKIENIFDPSSGCYPNLHPELWPIKKK